MTRQATKEDFKQGAILQASFGEVRILRKYDDGIWEARGPGGITCIFESDAKFYQIEDTQATQQDDQKQSSRVSTDVAKEVACIILAQLGGSKFIAMTGARNFLALNDGNGGMRFNLPRFPGLKINIIEIVLNGSDLYDVKFSRVHGLTLKEISSHTGIYFDQLRELFERETGLRTSL